MARSIWFPILVAALSGCSATVADEPGVIDEQEEAGGNGDRSDGEPEQKELGQAEPGSGAELETQAQFLVERVVRLDDGAIQTQSAAQFVRARASDMHALAGILASTAESSQAKSGCAWSAPREMGNLYARPDAVAELLDVGAVQLAVGTEKVDLARRAFPDVGGVVSGIIYTSRDGRARLLPARPYGFVANDWSQHGLPGVRWMAPSSPAGIKLNGVAIRQHAAGVSRQRGPVEAASMDQAARPWASRHGERQRGATVPLFRRGGLEVHWQVPADVEPGDRMQLELGWRGFARRLRCTFADTGSARVPEEVELALGPAEFTFRRVRRRGVDRNGRQKIRIRFDFAVRSGLLLVPSDADGP